jgi:hypothetical protein
MQSPNDDGLLAGIFLIVLTVLGLVVLFIAAHGAK